MFNSAKRETPISSLSGFPRKSAMNRTVAIFFGLALSLHGVISQTDAAAQSHVSSRRNHILREALIASAEHGKRNQLDETESKPTADSQSEAVAEQVLAPNEIESLSPRAVLDLSTTGRRPEQAVAHAASSDIVQASAREIKVVAIKGDQFYHRTVPFEEPLHERFGISHAPGIQLPKSTLVFFGKSLLLPANLLPRRHCQRDCDSNEGWREGQGRRACPDCK